MKTSELTGAALNWAVCLALGNKPVLNPVRFGGVSYGAFDSELGYAIKNYQGDWSEAGPIIEQEKIETYRNENYDFDEPWICYIGSRNNPELNGPTPLIAAMRCYCTSKLGDEIEIPEELR